MSLKQKTLGKGFQLKGKGLHTGINVQLSILPDEPNTGIKFKRTDVEGTPIIKANAEFVTDTSRGTTLEKGGVKISTLEHLMSALYGLHIDNALIELDGPEIPILDGSAQPFVEEIKKVGIIEQGADKQYFELKEKVTFSDPESDIEITAYPDDQFSIDVMVDYNSKVIGSQFASYNESDDYEKEIAGCKTFVFFHELEPLFKNNLIKGGDVDNAIVIIDGEYSQSEFDNVADMLSKPKVAVRPEGILNNVQLIHGNEPARHKLLDVIGDLALAGMPIKAKIVAKRPGHKANTELAKILRKKIKQFVSKPQPPAYDPMVAPLMDIAEIQRRLPHRAPFLLVDKITYLDDWVVSGIKNVTMNEPFFVGHFPNEPIMPGVLQVEAMAQVGGILLTSIVPDPENYLTIFLKIENVKFKHKVVPGDTLNIKMILLEPIKRGLALTKGYIFVGDKLVVEGEFMAQLTKKSETNSN